MVLPENLTTLASNSEANRLYHQEIAAALPWLNLDSTISVGQTGHLTDHDTLHDAVDRGLRKTSLNGLTGHGADHNVIHAYVNTTFQNEYHVTKSGNDGNSGTWASPKLTIGSAITAALSANASGQTARIRVHATTPGTTTVYREQVTIGSGGTTAAMVLEAAEDGVVVSGADDWSTSTGAWTVHDAPNRIYYKTWTNNWGVQAYPSGWEGFVSSDPILRRREVVVIDGVWVRQVNTLAEIDDYDAAYFVDEAADRLYVRLPTGGNIATIPIEVGLRERSLDATSRTNLTLRGLTFQHAVPLLQNPGVKLTSCTNPTVEDCTFRANSYGGFSAVTGNGLTARRCHFDDNGIIGYIGFSVADQLWEDCTNNRNNTFRGLWASYINWEDGAKVIFSSRITFRRCDWYDNNAPGCWFDTDNKNILLEDCRSKGNAGAAAYMFEATQGPVMMRRCKANANFRGLGSTSLRNLTMDDCDFWDNKFEAMIANFGITSITEWDTGQSVSVEPGNWTLQNNLFWATSTGNDKWLISGFNASDAAWNGWRSSYVGTNNAYHSTNNTSPYFVRDNTGSAIQTDFAGWKTNLGGGRDSTSTFSTSAPDPPPSL